MTHWYIPSWLRVLEQIGLDKSDEPLLWRIVEEVPTSSPTAAAMLLPGLDDSARQQLSSRVAIIGAQLGGDYLREDHLQLLVRTAPDAWAHAVHCILGSDSMTGLTSCTRLLSLLPVSHQQELIAYLDQRIGSWQLPWKQLLPGGSQMRLARPADEIARLMFDLCVDVAK